MILRRTRHFRQFMTQWATSLAVLSAVMGLAAPALRAQQYPALEAPEAASPARPPVLVAPPPGPAAPPSVLGAPPPPLPAPAFPSFANGVQFIAYPYLWLAGLNMAITTPLQRAPQVNVSIGPGEILGDLNNVPFMGAAELRYGPFGVLVDALHIPLGVPVTTRNIFYSGGNVGVVQSTVTSDFLYRVLDQPAQRIDAGLGFRFWDISTDTILNGREFIPTVSVSRSGSWTDPLIAARYHRDFGNGFGLTAYGDVGGFGIAAHADWEIIGTLDYMLKPWLDLQLGYRSLNVNYSASKRPLGFNIHEKGPIIAATLRF